MDYAYSIVYRLSSDLGQIGYNLTESCNRSLNDRN